MNYLLALLFPLVFLGCDKLRPCANYSFKGTITIVNDKPVFKQSDTVWLEIAADKTQINQQTNLQLTVNGADNFSQTVAIAQMLPDNKGVRAVKKFKIIIDAGEQITSLKPDGLIEVMLKELPEKYLARIGFLPLEPGIFELQSPHVGNVFSSGKDCTRGGYNFNYTNIDLHNYYGEEMVGHPILNETRQTYYFKVE